jgi:hypothetical protein
MATWKEHHREANRKRRERLENKTDEDNLTGRDRVAQRDTTTLLPYLRTVCSFQTSVSESR